MYRAGTGFAELDEIVKKTYRFRFDDEMCEVPSDGICVCSDGKVGHILPIEDVATIVGSTGSGKSLGVMCPSIRVSIAAGSSCVITDPKGDIYYRLRAEFERKDYEIKILNLSQPNRTSDTYNPLQIANEYLGNANEILNSVFTTIMQSVHNNNDVFWENAAINFGIGASEVLLDMQNTLGIKGLLTLKNVMNMFKIMIEDDKLFKEVLEQYADEPYSELMAAYDIKATQTLDGLKSVFRSAMSSLTCNSDMIKFTSTTSFDPSSLAKKKVALFIITSEDSSVYGPLVTIIIDQIYRVLNELARDNRGVLARRVNFYLDELGNTPKICDLDKRVTTCRSKNMRFYIALQSMEQLAHVYGEEVARTIIGNSTLVYLKSNDVSLLRYLEQLVGDIELEGFKRVPLISVSQLRNMKRGRMLILTQSMMPFVGSYSIEGYSFLEKEECEFCSRPVGYDAPELIRQVIVAALARKKAHIQRSKEIATSTNKQADMLIDAMQKEVFTLENELDGVTRVRLIKIDSISETAKVIAKLSGMSYRESKKLIEDLDEDDRVVCVDSHIAEELIWKLAKIKTFACIDDDFDDDDDCYY